ncbi:hypothetical protein ACRAWF_23280 [Streptomyces sp. L7]
MTVLRTESEPRLEEIADQVFAYVQPDGGWCLNNAGVIVSGGESALVDTAATEARALALRSAVRRVSPGRRGRWSTRTSTATTPSATSSSRPRPWSWRARAHPDGDGRGRSASDGTVARGRVG